MKKKNISQVLYSSHFDGERRHHAVYYRFFSVLKWSADELFAALLRLLVPYPGDDLTVIVDDTLCRRRGPQIFGLGIHHDPLLSSHSPKRRYVVTAPGHSWVTVSVWLNLPWGGGISIPLMCRLYRSKKYCSASQYRKRTQLARQMLDRLKELIPHETRMTVVCDREYGCRTVLKGLEMDFAVPVPSSAALYSAIVVQPARGRRLKGHRLPSPSQMQSCGFIEKELNLYEKKVKAQVLSFTCLWYRVTYRRKVKIIIVKAREAAGGVRVYASSHLFCDEQEILGRFSRRWSIEVMFREVKTHLGIEQVQNGWYKRDGKNSAKRKHKPGFRAHPKKGKKAVERTVPFIFFVYAITIVWFLRQNYDPCAIVAQRRQRYPYYNKKKSVCFYDMLIQFRKAIWRQRIIKHPVFSRVCDNSTQALIQLLSAA